MKFTIVFSPEDGWVQAYGTFTDRERAQKRAERMERDLDPDRDEAGGGVGQLDVVRIQPLVDWEQES